MFVLGKISDELIVEKIKSGDEKILVYLYEEYHSLIKSFILKNGGDENIIDDIVQDTVISLWRNVQKPKFLVIMMKILGDVNYLKRSSVRVLNEFKELEKNKISKVYND